MTTQYKLLYINNPGTETDIDEDISGNNNDGTIYGATQVDGKLGDCLSFDGVDDYVDVGNGASLDITSAITVIAWIYPLESKSQMNIITKSNGDGGGPFGWLFDIRSSKLYPVFKNTLGTIYEFSGNTNIPLNRWSQVAFTYDGTNLITYYNGVVDKSISASGTIDNSGSYNLLIGAQTGLYSLSFFNGKIDEVCIYSRALNQTEINSRYNGGTGKILNPSTETNLKGYWRFDPVGFDDISMYMGDFKLERELEKMLDKLTLKISRSIDSAANFVGFDPDIEMLFKFNNIGIFRGRVKTSNKKEYYDVEVYSSAEIINRTIAQRIYENTTPEAIFTDLINSYTDLTPVTTSVSGTAIEYFVADDYVGSIIKKLAEALDWSIYTDSSKNIYFRPRGAITNATVIRRQSASSNAILGKWKKDYNELCNDIRVTGSNVDYTTQKTFTGDGVTKTFVLDEQPTSIKVSIGGVEQNINTYTIFSELKSITFDSAPALSSSIVVDYNYQYPLYVARSDATSIAQYGKFSKIVFHKWAKTRADITVFAYNYLNTYKDVLLSNDIMMNASFITVFTPGEKVRIIDDLESYDNTYIINKIRLEYLKGIVELNVGSYIPIFVNVQSSMQERIKELEKVQSKSITFANAVGVASNLTVSSNVRTANEFSISSPITMINTLTSHNLTYVYDTGKYDFSVY